MGLRAGEQSVEVSSRGCWRRQRTLLFAIESDQSRLRLLAYFKAHV